MSEPTVDVAGHAPKCIPLSGSLAGRRIVVTGVSSGIGAATAHLLTHEGAAVVGIDLVDPTVEVEEFHHADLGDPASIDDVAAQIGGRVDGLVNAAGVPTTRPPRQIMAVNLFGLRQLTEKVLPTLADGASVVHVASCAGTGWPHRAELIGDLLAVTTMAEGIARFEMLGFGPVDAYFLSKEAVTVYAMTSATKHVSRRIRVNAVSPGAVYTPILAEFYASMNVERLDELRAYAGGREGYPAEIAAAIGFLLSRAASWVNGVNLIVDGGAETAVTLGVLAERA